jgi:phosphohistidine phosphatase
MLDLLLLRHAKSRWDEQGVADHARDLAPRGVKAARRMGQLLRERGLVPDLVLCSTARRASQTWQLASESLGTEVPIRFDERLYLASPSRMISVARELGAAAGRLLLVGHDPGLHRLAASLAAEGEEKLREQLAAKFPTAALAHLAIDVASWAGFTGQPGRLRGFWRPRDFGVAGD